MARSSDFRVTKIDNRQLSLKIRDALITMIKENCKDDIPFTLPNEDVLAEMLGVTRTSLREALSYFEQEGYITRRRGVGTVVNPKVVNCKSRLDLEMDFRSIIENMGYKERFELLEWKFTEEVIERISSEKKSYIWLEKVFYADDTPVIHCIDYIDAQALWNPDEHAAELAEINFWDFLYRYAREDKAYVMSDVDCTLPDERTAELLKIEKTQPVLSMVDDIYTVSHTCICHSEYYVRPGMLDFKILRRCY